jgi:hypothetical protein
VSKPSDEITLLIHRWQSGDTTALDQLLPQVYAELRAMAASSLARQGPSTLQPTALVHDVLRACSAPTRCISTIEGICSRFPRASCATC